MNYIDRINGSRGPVRGAVIPPDVLDFALSLKQPGALVGLPVPDVLQDYEPGARQIMMARTVGNWSVRLALTSHFASIEDSSVQFFGEMDPLFREELFNSILPEGELPYIDLSDNDVRGLLATSKRAQRTTGDRLSCLVHYFDVRPGSFPPDGWPAAPFGHNDVTLTQAFGRNKFTDADLPIISHNRRACGNDEEMFMHLLGNERFDPGASNDALAEVVATQLRDPAVIIEQVMQWEVAFALWQKYPALYAEAREGIHVLWPEEGAKAYRTHEVKRDSVSIMEQKGLYNAFEFAHPDMMIRALKILGKLGIEADVLAAVIPYDERSIQYQTRGARQWMGRELLARIEHILSGRVKLL